MQNKCVYKLHIEELLRQDKDIPKSMSDCENCTGFHSQIEKPCYMDLEHLLQFREYQLNKNTISYGQR